jgi:transcription elongation factor GreA
VRVAEVAAAYSAEAIRLQKMARSQKYDELEPGWMAAIEGNSLSLEEMASVLALVTRRNAEQAEMMLWTLLSMRTERMGAGEGLKAVKAIADLMPDNNTLREEVADIYKKACPEASEVKTLVEMTVLRRDLPLSAGVRLMEKLLTLPTDTYVLDGATGAAGRMVGLNPEVKAFTVAFGDEERHFDAVQVDRLSPLPADDFRVLASFERDRLKAMAKEQPDELIRFALKTFGPRLGFKALKSHLAPIIASSAWSKWWNAAKVKVKHSPYLEMSNDTQPDLVLLNRPESHEERVRAELRSGDGAPEKVAVALEYLKETSGPAPQNADLLKHLAEAMDSLANSCIHDQPVWGLAAMALVGETRRRGIDAPLPKREVIEDALSAAGDLSLMLNGIADDAVAEEVLAFLQEALPDLWPDVFAMALPGCSPGVCDWMANELVKAGHGDALHGSIATILQRSVRYAGALLWLWRATAGGRYPEALADLDRIALAIRLFSAVNELARGKDRKDLLADIRSALLMKNADVLRAAVQGLDAERAIHLRNVAQHNAGLSERAREQALQIIRDLHPDLFAASVPPWQENVIYTTPEGLERRRQDFNDLCHNRIPANAKAIGEAAARGDLSENAEFTAALEERDRLTERASNMEAELKMARLISPAILQRGAVGIGSTVTAHDLLTNKTERFVFLGPWDADKTKSIYSYRSPLGLAFMGRKKGDTVLLEAGGVESRWEIVEIEAGL